MQAKVHLDEQIKITDEHNNQRKFKKAFYLHKSPIKCFIDSGGDGVLHLLPVVTLQPQRLAHRFIADRFVRQPAFA